MKKTLFSILCFIGLSAQAQLPFRGNAVTSDISKIKGDFDTFSWKWLGYNSQSNNFYIKNGSSWLDLDGLYVGYKMSRNTATGQVTYVSSTNVTITDSNVYFDIANTNVPPNGTYLFEMFAWTPVTTNTSVSLAQGKITISQSLYQEDDGAFPWPASVTSLVNYLTIASAASTYVSNIINGGASGSTGTISRSGADVTITFPASSTAAITGLSTTQAQHSLWIPAISGLVVTAQATATAVSNEVDTLQLHVPAVSNLAQAAYDLGLVNTNWIANVSNSWFGSVAYLILADDTNRWNTAGLTAAWASNGVPFVRGGDGWDFSFALFATNYYLAGVYSNHAFYMINDDPVRGDMYLFWETVDTTSRWWIAHVLGANDDMRQQTPSDLPFGQYEIYSEGAWIETNYIGQIVDMYGRVNPDAYSDVSGLSSGVAENVTNSLMTLASNLFAHGAVALEYVVSSNNTNEIVWSPPFPRDTIITGLYWGCSVGAPTGIMFIANGSTPFSAWDSICYTGIACDVSNPSNAPVAISITAGQRVGTMASESTNYILVPKW